MQAIYYPISKIYVDASIDKELALVSNHDEYCLWFDVCKNTIGPISKIPMPMPKAGIHTCVSRTRLGQINDPQRNEKYITSFRKMLRKYVTQQKNLPKNILCISELTLLPLIAGVLVSEFDFHGKSDKVRIFVYESSQQMIHFLKLCEKTNQHILRNVEIVYSSSSLLDLEPKDLPGKVSLNLFIWQLIFGTRNLNFGTGGQGIRLLVSPITLQILLSATWIICFYRLTWSLASLAFRQVYCHGTICCSGFLSNI